MADLEDAIIEDEFPDHMSEMDTGSLPSPDELLKMLDGMGLSDEDKESLRADLLKSVENGNQYGIPPPQSMFASQALILFALLAFISLIFVFFGYKLYKSLIERERKREEKRKLRELKKKK